MPDPNSFSVSMPGDTSIVITRVFDAPRSLVFEAITQPALLQRWYYPDGWSLPVCEQDFSVGGRWRYVMRKPDGAEMGMYGVFREIAAPERLANTETWEDWNPGETLVTVELAESDGKTLMTSISVYPSREVRDIVAAGIESGAREMYTKLDSLLAELSAAEAR